MRDKIGRRLRKHPQEAVALWDQEGSDEQTMNDAAILAILLS